MRTEEISNTLVARNIQSFSSAEKYLLVRIVKAYDVVYFVYKIYWDWINGGISKNLEFEERCVAGLSQRRAPTPEHNKKG